MNQLIKFLSVTLLGFSSLLADRSVDVNYIDSQWRPFLNGQMEISQSTGFDEDSKTVIIPQDKKLKLTISNDKKFVPTVGLQTNIKDHKQRANIDSLIVFDSVAYSGGKAVDSQVDLTHRDHLIYYRLGYSDIDIDLGVNVVRFDGRVILRDTNMHEIIEHDQTRPGLYGSVQYDIPQSNFYFKANSTYVVDNSSEFNKARVMMGYRADSGIQLELGYQAYRAEWSDYKNTDGNLKFEGLYTGLRFNF